ncbi:hypothetical protein HTY54_21420 [Escherichia coli]|nr:hypothetical protein [Escherichia coli]
MTEKDITIKGKTTSQYLASVVVDNLPPRPFNIRMRRMTPDSTTDQLQNKNALVVIHRNHRCETVLPEHGTGRRAGGFGAVRQPAGEP